MQISEITSTLDLYKYLLAIITKYNLTIYIFNYPINLEWVFYISVLLFVVSRKKNNNNKELSNKLLKLSGLIPAAFVCLWIILGYTRILHNSLIVNYNKYAVGIYIFFVAASIVVNIGNIISLTEWTIKRYKNKRALKASLSASYYYRK